MRIDTAIKQIQKETEFLGLGFLEVMQDIQRQGRMVYSDRTVEAYLAILEQGRHMFEVVA